MPTLPPRRRSHAAPGRSAAWLFQGHYRRSKPLHRGFDLPDKLYKHGKHRQIQRGFSNALGSSEVGPSATATLSYNRNNKATLEAVDSKCRITYKSGDEWDQDNKSYSSYNIGYQSQDIRLDAERPDALEVKVGMGINLWPAAGFRKTAATNIFCGSPSSVDLGFGSNIRNTWNCGSSESQSNLFLDREAKLRSFLSYIDNIRTEEELSIYEQEEIALGTGSFHRVKCKYFTPYQH
ncbi:hypothetical protein B0H10DRAFT_1942057 [Mycena sp. CBHHK59/15]|nr:hypothetical protein B0H10DRAFT_1942057 [Mycena sp. CBHHK59/15]